MSSKKPFPQIEYNGRRYTLRRKRIEVPSLAEMPSLEAALWIARNTFPRGYQRETARIAASVMEK